MSINPAWIGKGTDAKGVWHLVDKDFVNHQHAKQKGSLAVVNKRLVVNADPLAFNGFSIVDAGGGLFNIYLEASQECIKKTQTHFETTKNPSHCEKFNFIA